MGILNGNPKDEPMHYGEIFAVWSYSAKKKLTISCYQAYLYHTGDHELKRLLENLLLQAQNEVKECDQLLLHNGLMPAPAFPQRPAAALEEIPIGARLTDIEISLLVDQDIATEMMLCSQISASSIRLDINALFSKYYALHVISGSASLQMMKEKGWLMPPPLHIHRPEN